MRNLKFRAWDGKHKKWLHGYELLGGCSIVGEIMLLGEWLRGVSLKDLNEICVEQYSGLQDKDCKEIYEGDIINVDYNNIGKILVAFEEGKYNVSDCNFNCVVIIGNVHENPDLLGKP